MVLFLYDWPVEHLSERIGIGDGRRTIQTLTRVGCSGSLGIQGVFDEIFQEDS